jgi:hypothetical protein
MRELAQEDPQRGRRVHTPANNDAIPPWRDGVQTGTRHQIRIIKRYPRHRHAMA